MNAGEATPTDDEVMLYWLLDHLHLIKVNIYAMYCDVQQTPSAGFQSLHVIENGRPWNIKGGHRENLMAAIRKAMEPPNIPSESTHHEKQSIVRRRQTTAGKSGRKPSKRIA